MTATIVGLILATVSPVTGGQLSQDPFDPKEAFGYSAQRVVEMGRSQWFDHYTEKEGQSTAAMSHAEYVYGKAIFAVHQSKLPTLSASDRKLIQSLRGQMSSLRETSLALGAAVTGGGTMWNPIYSGAVADVEEALGGFFGDKTARKRSTQAEVWQEYKAANAVLVRHMPEFSHYTPMSGRTADDTTEAFSRATDELRGLLATIATIKSKERREELMAFCQSCFGHVSQWKIDE